MGCAWRPLPAVPGTDRGACVRGRGTANKQAPFGCQEDRWVTATKSMQWQGEGLPFLRSLAGPIEGWVPHAGLRNSRVSGGPKAPYRIGALCLPTRATGQAAPSGSGHLQSEGCLCGAARVPPCRRDPLGCPFTGAPKRVAFLLLIGLRRRGLPGTALPTEPAVPPAFRARGSVTP